MTLSRLVLVSCLTAAVLPAPRIAFAETAQEKASRRHYDRAEKQFALGKFEDALEYYQKAYDADPRPGFLFNIGQCHRNIGDYESAVFSYKKYLKLEPDAGGVGIYAATSGSSLPDSELGNIVFGK